MSVRFEVDSDVVVCSCVVQVLHARRDACDWDFLLSHISEIGSMEGKGRTRTSSRYRVEDPLAYAVWTTPI